MSNSLVQPVPKVEGIQVQEILNRPMLVCQCGNAHKDKFSVYKSERVTIGERHRKIKEKIVQMMCNVCKNTADTEPLQKAWAKIAYKYKT